MEDKCDDGFEDKLSKGALAELLRTQKPPQTGRNIFRMMALRQLKQAATENGSSSGDVSISSEVLRYRVKFFDGSGSFESAVIVRSQNDRREAEQMPGVGSVVRVLSPDEEEAEGVVDRNRVREVNGRVVWVIYNIQPYTEENTSTPVSKDHRFAAATDGSSTSSASAPIKIKRGANSPPQSDDGNSASVQSVKRALFTDNDVGGGANQGLAPAEFGLPRGATHRIKDLNPYQNKFRIEGRVVQKSPLRTWSNSRGQGQVFDVTLRDESGDIKVAAFNDVAAKFSDQFVEGSLYALETATIKPIQNRRFNNTSHEYELFLHNGSKIIQKAGVEGLGQGTAATPLFDFKFTKASEVVESTPAKEKVDILAVVVGVNEATTVSTRFKSDTLKRDLTVLDDSGNSGEGTVLTATLWDDAANKLTPGESLNKVVAIKGALVSDWQGKSLSCGKMCGIQLEPEIEEARRLKVWYQETFGGNWAKHKSPGQLQQPSSSFNGSPVIVSLYEVKEMSSSMAALQQQLYFTVEAAIVSIKLDKLMYMACSNPSCRRKVLEVPSGSGGKTYRCEKCNTSCENFNWRYIIQATIADTTDYHFVTLFDEAAESVLQVKASDLSALPSSEYQGRINRCKFKLYQFRLRAKVESYNEEQRIKLTTIDVSPVDHKDPARLVRIRSEIAALEEELEGC